METDFAILGNHVAVLLSGFSVLCCQQPQRLSVSRLCEFNDSRRWAPSFSASLDTQLPFSAGRSGSSSSPCSAPRILWYIAKRLGLHSRRPVLREFSAIGTFMAMREQACRGRFGDHDWGILFGQWGLLAQDQKIGGTMRALGWMGMIAVVGWLGWQTYRSTRSQENASQELAR